MGSHCGVFSSGEVPSSEVHPSKVTLAAQWRVNWHGEACEVAGDDHHHHLEELGGRPEDRSGVPEPKQEDERTWICEVLRRQG